MAKFKEHFVTLEVAKLLAEAGFSEVCEQAYEYGPEIIKDEYDGHSVDYYDIQMLVEQGLVKEEEYISYGYSLYSHGFQNSPDELKRKYPSYAAPTLLEAQDWLALRCVFVSVVMEGATSGNIPSYSGTITDRGGHQKKVISLCTFNGAPNFNDALNAAIHEGVTLYLKKGYNKKNEYLRFVATDFNKKLKGIFSKSCNTEYSTEGLSVYPAPDLARYLNITDEKTTLTMLVEADQITIAQEGDKRFWDFSGRIETCDVVSCPKRCAAYIWNPVVDGKKQLRSCGIVCMTEADEEFARKLFEERNDLLKK